MKYDYKENRLPYTYIASENFHHKSSCLVTMQRCLKIVFGSLLMAKILKLVI